MTCYAVYSSESESTERPTLFHTRIQTRQQADNITAGPDYS